MCKRQVTSLIKVGSNLRKRGEAGIHRDRDSEKERVRASGKWERDSETGNDVEHGALGALGMRQADDLIECSKRECAARMKVGPNQERHA